MISMLNPKKLHQPIQEELNEIALKVVNSGQYILGQEVENFEKKCCEFLNCKYALGVSSGTDALILSLMAIDIQPGDEIICPSFTFFATAGAIARVGAIPVFVDINQEDFILNPSLIEQYITSKTVAIIPVSLYGQSCNNKVINEIAKKHNLFVIEDACQSIGAKNKENIKIGNLADVTCFSFFPSKNLGALGDAGLIATNNESLYNILKLLRVHGAEQTYFHSLIGGNFRIDALQAAFLNCKIQYLNKWIERRRENAAMYFSILKDNSNIQLPKEINGTHTYNQFTILTKKRDELKKYLLENKVMSAIYYPLPLHKQKCFKYANSLYLENTEKVCSEVLSLPIAPEIEIEEIKIVANLINQFFNLD